MFLKWKQKGEVSPAGALEPVNEKEGGQGAKEALFGLFLGEFWD